MFAPEFIVSDGTLVTSKKKVKYTPNPFKLWSPNLDLSANSLRDVYANIDVTMAIKFYRHVFQNLKKEKKFRLYFHLLNCYITLILALFNQNFYNC